MNAKLFAGVSTLVLAAASASVSAQTVPAEQWVGAPIQTTASQMSRTQVKSDFVASRADFNGPQEYRVGAPDSTIGALSRAEVAADLSLWNKSGMGAVAYAEGFDPTSARVSRRMATYQAMRNGSEYVAEIQRIKGTSFRANIAKFGASSNAN